MAQSQKPKRPTKAELQWKIVELEAQFPSTYYYASQEIHKAGESMMASGVLLQLTALGGRQLIKPTVIKDGLSKETIDAILADFNRSFDSAVSYRLKT